MNKAIKIAFGLIFPLVLLYSCKKDEASVPDFGYNFSPEQVGKYIVYDVDSFYYNDFTNQVDSFKFQIKEKIESFYYDNENRKTMRLERYVRSFNDTIPYASLPWILKDVWSANKTTTTYEKVEENVRFIKLAFPVKEEQVWNGNAQNTIDGWDYKYEFIDRPRTVAGITFDSVLQVTQLDDKLSNLIKHQYYIEWYARNVGMIYKKVIDVESQPGNPIPPNFFQIPIMQRVTSGVQYIMTYNTSGVE